MRRNKRDTSAFPGSIRTWQTTCSKSPFSRKPVKVNVEKEAFLNEGNVDQASVLDQDGVVLIKVQFDKRGSWLLENITASNPGKRIAIFSQFSEGRWLAAPLISRRIGDGVLIFTPDANRPEAERIVRGLNNVAAKAKKINKF
jgi:preprotein translocase subunit SecD